MAIISNATTIADAGAFSVSLGSMVHIKTLTASSSATLSFVHGTADVVLDSTYPIYVFKFINMHPQNDDVTFSFQGNAVGESGYNETITSTAFYTQNREDNSATALEYRTGEDQAQGTAFQPLSEGLGNANDESLAGTLRLFNPSSTTFVKHFMTTTTYTRYNERLYNFYIAGYFNTTSAIDEIQFKMESGNIDAGQIKLYGIKDS